MIKKFKIELIILSVLILNIFISYNIDIGFYNYFKNYESSLQKIYLKEFFIQITTLGDSLWYFVFSIIFIFIGLILRGNDHFKKYKNILNINLSFNFYLFVSVLITGLLTQLLKHIVGRPRPNYTNLNDNVGFEFFSLGSEFHSFPSGHTSTIFSVALVLLFFFPKSKYIVLFFASIIAFSRVVVGAHFFTDVLGGIVVAYLGVKITKFIFEKINFGHLNKNKKEVVKLLNKKNYFLYFFIFFLIIFITIAPSLDLFVSGFFYFGESQFLLQSYYDVTVFFRKVILRGIIVYILLIPILCLFLPLGQLYFNHKFNIKEIIFLWVSSLLNWLIVINLLLKNIWGRARPGDTLQLGGKENFTPWFQYSDACNTNCSFVSGDASIGFSIIVLYFITKKEVYFWLSLLFGSLLGLVRIMEGGHFLSDVVMSSLIIFIFYYYQIKYFNKNV